MPVPAEQWLVSKACPTSCFPIINIPNRWVPKLSSQKQFGSTTAESANAMDEKTNGVICRLPVGKLVSNNVAEPGTLLRRQQKTPNLQSTGLG